MFSKTHSTTKFGTCTYVRYSGTLPLSLQTEELLDAFFSDSVLKMYGRTVIQEPYVQLLNDSAETLMMLTGESGLFPMDLNTTVFFLTSVVKYVPICRDASADMF